MLLKAYLCTTNLKIGPNYIHLSLYGRIGGQKGMWITFVVSQCKALLLSWPADKRSAYGLV